MIVIHTCEKNTIEFRVANESLAAQIQIFVTSYSRKKIRGQGVRLLTVINGLFDDDGASPTGSISKKFLL